jgi:hypothetical protein
LKKTGAFESYLFINKTLTYKADFYQLTMAIGDP